MFRAKALALLIILGPPSLHATDPPQDFGTWYAHFGTVRLNDEWSVHLENQYRAYNLGTDIEQILNRAAINYHVPDTSWIVSGGYAYIYSEPILGPAPDDQGSVDEHRLFQQLIYRHNLERLFFTHRLRLEQRWIEQELDWRFRYFLGCQIPLNREDLSPGSIYASLYSEQFLNLQGHAFDRNRLYAGLGYVVSPDVRFEAAFMRQALREWSESPDQFVFSLFWTL